MPISFSLSHKKDKTGSNSYLVSGEEGVSDIMLNVCFIESDAFKYLSKWNREIALTNLCKWSGALSLTTGNTSDIPESSFHGLNSLLIK